MLERLSQRILTLLQLTRMALVFTAVSNSLTTLLLLYRREHPTVPTVGPHLDWGRFLTIAFVSFGLYGFGMSLNDIIDRRRDRQMAAHRPLPSGRIALITAHVICVALALMALIAGVAYWSISPNHAGWRSFTLILLTAALIVFYDFAGKYLVAGGLVTLGLIRACHAMIPAGQPVILWHTLVLLDHTAILSTVCYAWEGKRPPLTRGHWLGVFGGLAGINLLAIGIGALSARYAGSQVLDVTPALVLPFALAGVFVLLAWLIRWSSSTSRQAGQTVMLIGLLWLIVYDAAFAYAYIGLAYAGVVLLLVPFSYMLVLLMRWWASIVLISQTPAYKRTRSTSLP